MSEAKRIDEYARSMFAFDRPNDSWVEACSNYLKSIFGPRLENATFLDYAFGRGNWSLAALRAGARRVIAIDASESNVRNLSNHCKASGLDAIEIVHGNILESAIPAAADILWVYGILHHVDQQAEFLQRLASMRKTNDAAALFYTYDAGSLREAIVTAARKAYIYDQEKEFADDSLLFAPAARMRARDDLTAPHVSWATREGLASLSTAAGFAPTGFTKSFAAWRDGADEREFKPHHLVCGVAKVGASLPDLPRAEQFDIDLLAELANAVVDRMPYAARRSFAIGLMNTHFTALGQSVNHALCDDFRYLAYCVLRLGISRGGLARAGALLDACLVAAERGQPCRIDPAIAAVSSIGRQLANTNVRF